MAKDTKVTDAMIKAVQKLTEGEKTAIVLIEPSFKNGSNWILLPDNDRRTKGYIEDLLTVKKNLVASRVSNGYVVQVDKRFIVNSINSIAGNSLNHRFVDYAQKREKEAKDSFSRFLTRLKDGKVKQAKKIGNGLEITIAVYSLNEVETIRLRGVDYPAYRVTLMEALQAFHELSKEGYVPQVKAKHPNGDTVFDNVFSLASNTNGLKAINEALEISDTDTGVFVTLRLLKTK